MAYSGWLIKIGNSTALHQYIAAQTYKVTKHIQDLDPYRDANGKLHRNALSHVSYTVTFDTRSINNTQMEEIMSVIRSNFSNAAERKIDNFTFYLPETNDYVTAPVYLPDIDFKINLADSSIVKYEPTTFEFIGY